MNQQPPLFMGIPNIKLHFFYILRLEFSTFLIAKTAMLQTFKYN